MKKKYLGLAASPEESGCYVFAIIEADLQDAPGTTMVTSVTGDEDVLAEVEVNAEQLLVLAREALALLVGEYGAEQVVERLLSVSGEGQATAPEVH